MDVISVDDTMLEDLSASETRGVLRCLVQTCLTPRERDIVEQRYGLDGKPPRTQREIAAACGISRNYVSRLEKKALEKLGRGIRADAEIEMQQPEKRLLRSQGLIPEIRGHRFSFFVICGAVAQRRLRRTR